MIKPKSKSATGGSISFLEVSVMLYIFVIIMFSGQAVVIERQCLHAGTCASIEQQFIEAGRAATFACLERFDA